MKRVAERLAVAAALALAAGCMREPAVADAGPDLASWDAVSLADGKAVRFSAEDGPVVLNVWASWCEPCRREMPALEAAHRHLEARGIRVVGINIDRDILLAREHARRMGLTFANVSDPAQALARDRLGVRRLPTTLGVDAGGRLRWREESARDWSEAGRLAWVEATLAGEGR